VSTASATCFRPQVLPEDRDYFDLYAKTCEYAPSDRNYRKSVEWNLSAIARGQCYADAIEQYMPLRGKRALDIGCGSGGVCIAFAQRGALCTGIEPAEYRLEWAVARTRGHQVQATLISKKLEDTDFPDGAFDVITATDVLEHVEDYRIVMRKMCDLLAPGGLIFATVPNGFHVRNILAENHTGLFGVLLLPMKWRPFYVVNVRKAMKSHHVSYFPPCHTLVAICQSRGLVVLEPVEIAKLSHPEGIRRRWLQTVVHALLRLFPFWPVYHRLISWFLLPPTYTLVAQKR
jgi:2-polyprenyl-3-methyl-5-hydroxy-6-metoxy-1,4-benzoquinol methylase